MVEPVVVRFHRSIYTRSALDRSIERFAALGSFEVAEHDNDWKVSIEPARESLRDRIADELANHVLAGTAAERVAR